jgi:hypothetical protein
VDEEEEEEDGAEDEEEVEVEAAPLDPSPSVESTSSADTPSHFRTSFASGEVACSGLLGCGAAMGA